MCTVISPQTQVAAAARPRLAVAGRAGLAVALCLVIASCKPTSTETPMSAGERAMLPGLIVFVRERQGGRDVWAVRPTGEERPVSTGPADEYPGAASPDGEHLAIVAARDEQGVHLEQILWVPLDAGAAVPLGPPSPRARLPVFAPDGGSVLAESGTTGFSDIARFAVPPALASTTTLVRRRTGAFEPAISPDGRWVAYVSSDEGDPEVYLARADGTFVRRLTAFDGEDVAPAFSPDGAWVAWLSRRERRRRVYLVRLDGTGFRPLVAAGPTGDEEAVLFRPHGDDALVVERLAGGGTRLWRAPLDAGRERPRPLTDGSHKDEMPAWSPDGRAYVFVSDRSGDLELYLARADGTGVTRLTDSPGPDWLPRWAPAPREGRHEARSFTPWRACIP